MPTAPLFRHKVRILGHNNWVSRMIN